MIRPLLLGLALWLVATGARAEWVWRPPEAADDTGSAFVLNAQGHRLDIGCGNGGFVNITLTPDTRPADLKFVSSGAVIYFSVDGGQPLQMPASCGDYGCYQDYRLGAEPWPVGQMRAITSALQAGSMVEVLLGGKVMSRFDLTRSSAALGALKAHTQCEGL